MTRQEAFFKLCETRTLSTDLLKPLGINHQAFVALVQVPQQMRNRITERLIMRLATTREERMLARMDDDAKQKADEVLNWLTFSPNN